MIAIDTHALVWWVTGDPALSKPAAAAIENEQVNGGEIIASAISAWEIALLVERERLVLSMDVDKWLAPVPEIEAVRFVPVDMDVATKSVVLPGAFHNDTADRIIVATARALAAPLTSDTFEFLFFHPMAGWIADKMQYLGKDTIILIFAADMHHRRFGEMITQDRHYAFIGIVLHAIERLVDHYPARLVQLEPSEGQ